MKPRFERLVHVGNVVVDLVMTVADLPSRGGDMLAGHTTTVAGGGFNVIAAAARQGLAVTYAGRHGTGPFGEIVRTALRSEGVTVTAPATPVRDTGVVVTLVDAGGERTFITSPGAETTLASTDVDGITVTGRDAVHLSGYSLVHPEVGEVLRHWLPTLPDGATVFFDPGPLIEMVPPGVLDPIMERVDWFTGNAREAQLMSGATSPEAAATALALRTGRHGVIVRTDASGCLLRLPGRELLHVNGFPVVAVDSNGAGDAHTGVFIAMLGVGHPPAEAARISNAAAALAVTRRGPATSPTAAELAQFLSQH